LPAKNKRKRNANKDKEVIEIKEYPCRICPWQERYFAMHFKSNQKNFYDIEAIDNK
jgi:hypothetical protein